MKAWHLGSERPRRRPFSARRAFSALTPWLLPALLPALGLPGQPFSAQWSRAGAPGGVSSGAAHRVSGSAGQAEAGIISGGGYRVRGGFWPGLIARGYGTSPPFPTEIALSPDHGFAGQSFTATGRVAPGSAGVRILWDNGETSLGLAERAVAADGSFSVSLRIPAGAMPGAVSVVALPTHSGGTDAGAAAFTVEAAPPGRLTGTIALNQGAAPVAGATVRLLDASGWPLASTTTDAQGNYSFGELSAGSYLVEALKDGVFISTQPATVEPGGLTVANAAPIPLENLPAPALVSFVHGIALPIGALSEFSNPVLVTDIASAQQTGEIARFGTLPPDAAPVHVRFWALGTFPPNVPQSERAVMFEVLDAAGQALWKIKKNRLDPVFPGLPSLDFPAYTSTIPVPLAPLDMNVSSFPPGELFLRVTPFIGDKAGYGKFYTIRMVDLTSRWFQPWVKRTPDPQTGRPIRFTKSGTWLKYVFNGALPNSGFLPWSLPITVPVFNYTFKNELSLGVESLQEAFIARPGKGIQPGALKPKLKASATLMNQSVFNKSWPYQPVLDAGGQTVGWQIKNFTAAGPKTFATIPIYQNGPGIGCFDPCPDLVCGCDCPVCVGWKLTIEFTVGGSVSLSSKIKENFGLDVLVTPAVNGTLGGYLKARGLICGADAHVTGTATVKFPIQYRSEPDSLDLLDPCISLQGSLGADIGCLGIGFGAGGTIGPINIFGCSQSAAAAPQVELHAAAAVDTLQIDPAPAVAASGQGRAVNLWVENVSQDPNGLAPFLYARFYDGLAWGAAQRITPAAALVSDPKAGFLGPNRAVALWVQSKESLATILTAGRTEPGLKEIYYALWDGAAWGAPVAITDDANADGSPALATDRARGRAIAAWVRRLNAPEAGAPHSVFALVYTVFNGTGWSAPLPIVLEPPAVDWQVALEYDAAGNAWAAWLRDADGDLTTYADRQLCVARLLGDGWTEPERIPNVPAGAFSPALALDAQGQPLVVFLQPPMIGEELTSGLSNRSVLWAAYRRAGVWETAAVGPEIFAETPELEILPGNRATIMFRRFSLDDLEHRDGDLAAATADLAQQPLKWTSDYLTDDGQTNWKVNYAFDAGTRRNFVVNVKQGPFTGVFAAPSAPARRLARTHSVEVRSVALQGPAVTSMVFDDQPDLTLTAQDISFSDSHPLPGDTVTITATLRNQGLGALAAGTGFTVNFYDGPPPFGAAPFHQVTLAQPLALGETTEVTATYRVSQGGLHDITVVVDADNQVAESDEANNVATAVLGQVPPPGDLVVRADFDTPAVVLEWDAPATSGLARYDVFRADSPGGAFTLVGSTTGTSFVDALATPGREYRYAVTATDDFGVRSATGGEVVFTFERPELPAFAPVLAILESGGVIALSWFDPGGDFVLQETDHLPAAPAEWTAVQEPIVSDGSQRQLISTPTAARRFFRLTRL